MLERIGQGWSLERVAGRLEYGRKAISHRCIYRFMYAQILGTADFRWRRYRRAAEAGTAIAAVRRQPRKLHRRPCSPMTERSVAAADRSALEHLEAHLKILVWRTSPTGG